jgi:hypothetical protein
MATQGTTPILPASLPQPWKHWRDVLICTYPEAVYRLTLHQHQLAPRLIGSSPASDLHGFGVWALHGRCQIRGFKSVEEPTLVATQNT